MPPLFGWATDFRRTVVEPGSGVLRIGIDCAVTNPDAVILSLSLSPIPMSR